MTRPRAYRSHFGVNSADVIADDGVKYQALSWYVSEKSALRQLLHFIGDIWAKRQGKKCLVLKNGGAATAEIMRVVTISVGGANLALRYPPRRGGMA